MWYKLLKCPKLFITTPPRHPKCHCATQLDTRLTYLEKIEVSVELGTFCVLQSFQLSCDEHEDVLETRERLTEKGSHKTHHGCPNTATAGAFYCDEGTLSLSGEVYGASGAYILKISARQQATSRRTSLSGCFRKKSEARWRARFRYSSFSSSESWSMSMKVFTTI